jgi:uncharacterized membrane protein
MERVMLLFITGLVIFLGVHSIAIVAPSWRDAQAAWRGDAVWKGLYSVASIVGFVLLIYGYGLARQSPVALYTPLQMLRHIALALMLPVFPLLLATYLPGRISAAAKHPMLLAVKIWASAHLLANGTLVDVLLFGSFLAWGVLDRIAAKRRAIPRRVPGAPPSVFNDAIALVGGLALYVVFLMGVHLWLIGVSPLA